MALGLAVYVGGAASAATPLVAHQGWAATGPAAPANPTPGSLYVSAVGGQEQARVFIQLDLAGWRSEEVAAATLTLGPGSDGVMADQATLAACALTAPLTADGHLAGAGPGTDCTTRAPLSRANDGRWMVALSAFAARWSAGGPTGVAIIPSTPIGPSVFTASFIAAHTVVVDRRSMPAVSSSPASPQAGPTVPPLVAAPSVVAPLSASSANAAPDPLAPVSPPLPAASPTTARGGAAGSTAPSESTAATNRGRPRRTDHPSWLVLAVPAALAAVVAMCLRRPRRRAVRAVTAGKVTGARAVGWTAWAIVPLVASRLPEPTVYKLGLVAIVFIAAIGLHLLVNWCGELSLAHAGFLGVPAFMAAQVAVRLGFSPIVALPAALLSGIALGCLVGAAALRARGLQVALVTLAIGIAIDQFFFMRSWVIGPPQGLGIPTPSLFGMRLGSSRSLVPVLTLAVLLAVVTARSVMRSTIGRALLQVRSDPDAAAAAGVAVARYRAFAYALAGGFAGLAGWSYLVWVRQISPKAFPLQLGFTYLVIAALAGPGGLVGVAIAAVVIEGGALFSILPGRSALYIGPLALIFNVTRYRAGLNGLWSTAVASLWTREGTTMEPRVHWPARLRPLTVGAVLIMAVGVGAIGLAWYHMGNTDQVWIQNQELVSGGLLGLGLIFVGSALLVREGIVYAAELGRSGTVPAPDMDATPTELRPPEHAGTLVTASRTHPPSDLARIGEPV